MILCSYRGSRESVLPGTHVILQLGLENISDLIQMVEHCIIYSVILISSFYFFVKETRNALFLRCWERSGVSHFPSAH